MATQVASTSQPAPVPGSQIVENKPKENKEKKAKPAATASGHPLEV